MREVANRRYPEKLKIQKIENYVKVEEQEEEEQEEEGQEEEHEEEEDEEEEEEEEVVKSDDVVVEKDVKKKVLKRKVSREIDAYDFVVYSTFPMLERSSLKESVKMKAEDLCYKLQAGEEVDVDDIINTIFNLKMDKMNYKNVYLLHREALLSAGLLKVPYKGYPDLPDRWKFHMFDLMRAFPTLECLKSRTYYTLLPEQYEGFDLFKALSSQEQSDYLQILKRDCEFGRGINRCNKNFVQSIINQLHTTSTLD